MVNNNDAIKMLLIEKLAGTISAEDDLLVINALRTDPEVQVLWAELKANLDTPRVHSFVNQLDAQKSWNKIYPHFLTKSSSSRGLKPYQWLSAAAILLLMGLAGLLFFRSPAVDARKSKRDRITLEVADGNFIDLSGKTKNTINIGQTKLNSNGKQLQYATAANASATLNTLTGPAKMDYKLFLSDGSEVWLNSASSIRFPFSFKGKTREVYLEGEAYFKIAKNPKQPFIVHTSCNEIKVLGTSFNVRAYTTGETVTSLVEGSVVASSAEKNIRLQPQQQAVYKRNTGFEIRAFDEKNTLSWMHGVYYFYDQPLMDIVKMVPVFFGVEAVIDHPDLNERRLSGSLNKHDSLDVFLANIEAAAGIQHYYTNGILHLK